MDPEDAIAVDWNAQENLHRGGKNESASPSLFIQDNKTKQKRPENNIGLMEAILTVKGNVPESVSSVRDIPS